MTRVRVLCTLLAASTVVALAAPPLHAQSTPAPAAKSAKKEFAFKGTVQKIDAKTKMLTVDGENVPGWMSAMTMMYSVDDATVVGRLKAGDKISATVREGDFQKLYGVKVVPPAPAKK